MPRYQTNNYHSTAQMERNQRIWEKLNARRYATKALSLPMDAHIETIRAEMNERLVSAFQIIDGTDADADHADLIDTQECARA